MVRIKTYIVTVQHDHGELDIALVASNRTVARELVMKAEGCPATAIKHVRWAR